MAIVRKLHRADATAPEWERVVFSEVLIPDTPNVYGDYWTREAIKDAAYKFQMMGFGIDVDHDNVDVTGDVHVVESFIARPGDPDFIEGSWVVGVKILSDDLWARVLRNEINGFSYEATLSLLDGTLQVEDDGVRTGVTEPDPTDGHVHSFMVFVDDDNRPESGGTDTVNGHAHTITYHTVTDESAGHSHRYNLVIGKDGK